MTMKHTPGPWKANFGYLPNPHPHAVFADDAPSGAKMPSCADTEANARLIAAAPDLLAACEALMSCPLPLLDTGREGLDPVADAAVRAARAAIRKARGQNL